MKKSNITLSFHGTSLNPFVEREHNSGSHGAEELCLILGFVQVNAHIHNSYIVNIHKTFQDSLLFSLCRHGNCDRSSKLMSHIHS